MIDDYLHPGNLTQLREELFSTYDYDQALGRGYTVTNWITIHPISVAAGRGVSLILSKEIFPAK